MGARESKKAQAWQLFDLIVAAAADGGVHSNPWAAEDGGKPRYRPDYATLERLLGVPLLLEAETQSGVPALALDVWLSYELRRAGFDVDQVWPRPTHPRILPAAAVALMKSLPKTLREQVEKRVFNKASVPGVTSSSANILGKNYLKQVDVIMTDWATGPELLVSTKRMDSSFGKNAPNRIEESYGDAKNLRLRHPLAALGFMFGLNAEILETDRRTANWLFDLLAKLGLEDDAYHATCVVLMEYSSKAPDSEVGEMVQASIPSLGIDMVGDDAEDEACDIVEGVPSDVIAQRLGILPKVTIRLDETPEELSPALFLQKLVNRVLDTTPVNMHEEARLRRKTAA